MPNLKDIAENIKKNNLDKALNLCDDCDDVNNQHVISNFRGVIYLITVSYTHLTLPTICSV